MSDTIAVTINGTRRHLATGATVHTMLEEVLGPGRAGIAVAVNGAVVPESLADRPLAAGDQIEILTAIRGG